jgi:hypothetical protein
MAIDDLGAMLAAMPLTLDHLGFVSAAGGSLRAAYRRLGFNVTQPQDLSAADAAGRRSPLGQRSCHAMMQQGYIELSEVCLDDPAHHLADYLRRGPGLHILALGSNDIDGAHQRCRSAGLSCSDVRWAARDITYGESRGVARFEWFMIAPQDAPEGLVCVVRNHTPQLVHQRQVMQHPNGAVALRGIVLACGDVDAAAARYARIAGVAVETAGAQQCLRLNGGVIVLRPAAAAQESADRFAAAIVAVGNLPRAGAWLQAQGLPFEDRGAQLRLHAQDAGGAGLVLVPA